MVIVHTQVKEAVQGTGLGVDNISADFYERLEEKVRSLISEACRRAKENGRKTVMGKDV